MFTFDGETFSSISSIKRDKLDILVVNNKHCRAEISLFGAQVLSYIPKADNIDRLWVSNLAVFDKTKPIRGGIPVCWPWFGNLFPKTNQLKQQMAPAHGFVRNQDWQILDIQESEDATTLSFTPNTLGLFQISEQLTVTLEVRISHQLELKLITENSSDNAIIITAALHSYFDIANIESTQIFGVNGSYVDQVDESKTRTLTGPYSIQGETDRIHIKDDSNHLNNIDIVSTNNIGIKQAGHDSVVIWNPWIEKSSNLGDMERDGWRSMLCIEAAVTQGIEIAPGSQHTLMQTIS